MLEQFQHSRPARHDSVRPVQCFFPDHRLHLVYLSSNPAAPAGNFSAARLVTTPDQGVAVVPLGLAPPEVSAARGFHIVLPSGGTFILAQPSKGRRPLQRRLPRTHQQFQRAGSFVHCPARAGQHSRGFSFLARWFSSGRIDCAGGVFAFSLFFAKPGAGLFQRPKQSGCYDAAGGCSRGWPREG